MNPVAPGRLWPWLMLGFVVVPVHPLWIDFEQVRRGLLLVAAGLAGCMALATRAAGERWLLALIGWLLLAGLLRWCADAWFLPAGALGSFQPFEAVARLLGWMALWVVLRCGAATGDAVARPLALLLAATCALGLAQRLGVELGSGLGSAREPVSLFGNLNVAAEWTAVAAAGTAALWPALAAPGWRWLGRAALLGAGAYTVVNQSRSAIVALPLGLLLLALLRRRERGYVPLALAAAGAAAGLLLTVAAPRPAPTDDAARRAELLRGTATLAVRLEIARSAARLFSEAPVLGHGPGQFAVQYPRVRSAAEIETSSHGRQFATEVRTAHDDWLELLVDGGVPALLLFGLFAIALARRQPDKPRLAPLFVLLLLMLIRAPLGNAPAAAVALWIAAAPAGGTPQAAHWTRWPRVACGLAAALLGALIVAANTSFTSYLAARRDGRVPSLGAVRAARALLPFEPRWYEIEAQEALNAGDLAHAARLAARAVALRPFAPQYQRLLAEVLARGARHREAEQLAREGLALDPGDPELRVLLSTALAQQGRAEEAIRAVVDDPHPRLRDRLARHFGDLAELCAQRGDQRTALRFWAEHHFVAALDLLGSDELAARELTNHHIQQLAIAQRETGELARDARYLAIAALQAQRLGTPEIAAELGARAAERGAPLLPWQRALLGDRLAALVALPEWQRFLER